MSLVTLAALVSGIPPNLEKNNVKHYATYLKNQK
jgi:hypothetical protein